MIILRYLIKEIFKSQLAILFILLLIFFCQKLVRILTAAVEGDIPTNLIFSLLALGIPEMAQLILPLSLFLAILMTYGRLYAESEITAMLACGISKKFLINAVVILSVVTAALATLNNGWISPWSAKHQDQLIATAKANPNLAGIVEGQFQQSSSGSTVLYIGNVDKNQIENIFLAQLNPSDKQQRPSIIVSNHGEVKQDGEGNQIIYLDEGTRYEGTASIVDFRITDFTNYQAIIGHQNITLSESNDIEQVTLLNLVNSNIPDALIELNWRLTLIFSAPLMAFLVIPLSEVNPRQGRIASMLPAILLYLIFFLLQSSLRSSGLKGKFDSILWMYVVNGVYLILGIILNLWDTTPARRLRAKLRGIA